MSPVAQDGRARVFGLAREMPSQRLDDDLHGLLYAVHHDRVAQACRVDHDHLEIAGGPEAAVASAAGGEDGCCRGRGGGAAPVLEGPPVVALSLSALRVDEGALHAQDLGQPDDGQELPAQDQDGRIADPFYPGLRVSHPHGEHLLDIGLGDGEALLTDFDEE